MQNIENVRILFHHSKENQIAVNSDNIREKILEFKQRLFENQVTSIYREYVTLNNKLHDILFIDHTEIGLRLLSGFRYEDRGKNYIVIIKPIKYSHHRSMFSDLLQMLKGDGILEYHLNELVALDYIYKPELEKVEGMYEDPEVRDLELIKCLYAHTPASLTTIIRYLDRNRLFKSNRKMFKYSLRYCSKLLRTNQFPYAREEFGYMRDYCCRCVETAIDIYQKYYC